MARSESDRAFAKDVSTSASKKSDHVTSRMGVATRKSVFAKKCLFPCRVYKLNYPSPMFIYLAGLMQMVLQSDAKALQQGKWCCYSTADLGNCLTGNRKRRGSGRRSRISSPYISGGCRPASQICLLAQW